MSDTTNPNIDEAIEALCYSQCPYYITHNSPDEYGHKGAGVCNQHCWDEPCCIVDQPTEGWVNYARTLLQNLDTGE